MLVWGWRIPFLLSLVTLVVAAILRYNMPESSEFALSREEIDDDYVRRHNKGSSNDGGSTSGDVERAAAGAATADKQHYTPFVELMRGYWAGLIMHSCYGACERAGGPQLLGCTPWRCCARWPRPLSVRLLTVHLRACHAAGHHGHTHTHTQGSARPSSSATPGCPASWCSIPASTRT